MCLIIERQPNFEIPYKKFETAIENNPDGFGITYPEDGRLQVLRSAATPDPEKLYRLINDDLSDVPVSVHLRYTTAGATNLRNAHPFPILEKSTDGIDLRMCHNGTLHKYKQMASKDESDTRAFVRNYVRPLFKRMAKAVPVEELLQDEFLKMLLEDQLTASSVLSFIDSDGRTLTCNETGNGGKREEGWWYSNTYSFNPTHRVNPTTTAKVYPIGQPSLASSTDSVFPDCQTERFTKKYKLVGIEDCFHFTDETIETISKSPKDSELLIKELLSELHACKEKKNVH